MAEEGDEAAEGKFGIYVCDLQAGLTEEELRDLFERFGDVASMEQVDDACEESVIVEYTTAEAAEEAREMLNFALVRGKTCRCIALETVELIQKSMESGQRLLAQSLDPSIEGRGFWDLCALFGQVLDCKVELNGEQKSRQVGFVHFAKSEDAKKALTFMHKLQVGQSAVELRAFDEKDVARFTGASYYLGSRDAAPASGEDGDEEGEKPLPNSPAERARVTAEHCKTLERHYVEVIDTLQGKFQRLKALIETYTPNQDQQMVVIASSEQLKEVTACIGECLEEADYDSVSSTQAKEERQSLVMGFQTGNIFILSLTDDLAVRRDFRITGSPAVLVNFSFPGTVDQYLYRLYRRGEATTRIHSLFQPSVDGDLAVPLMTALEEAGHEIPEGLVALWSKGDQESAT